MIMPTKLSTTTNAKRLSEAKEQEEIHIFEDLFFQYIANPRYHPKRGAKYPIWTKLD